MGNLEKDNDGNEWITTYPFRYQNIWKKTKI
jgi:hypothetical protein